MNNPQEIRDIADERLSEAEILLANNKFDGAFYLTGYCAELYFKAKICENLNIPNLYVEDPNSQDRIVEKGFPEIRKAFKKHDLKALLILSGLKNAYQQESVSNRLFTTGGSILFNEWSEHCRYQACGYCSQAKAASVINFLKDAQNGFKQWINQI